MFKSRVLGLKIWKLLGSLQWRLQAAEAVDRGRPGGAYIYIYNMYIHTYVCIYIYTYEYIYIYIYIYSGAGLKYCCQSGRICINGSALQPEPWYRDPYYSQLRTSPRYYVRHDWLWSHGLSHYNKILEECMTEAPVPTLQCVDGDHGPSQRRLDLRTPSQDHTSPLGPVTVRHHPQELEPETLLIRIVIGSLRKPLP